MIPSACLARRRRRSTGRMSKGCDSTRRCIRLTLLASGLYGRELPAQNGAPLRLVVPWKYGFKGIKSIVRITLTAMQPKTTWNTAAPREYGFFSNVNPEVAHPRWSQATEQRIGESGRRPTLMFNGYAEQVGHLYAGMDLKTAFLTRITSHEGHQIRETSRAAQLRSAGRVCLACDALRNQLGANPVNFAIRTTGLLALVFLLLSLDDYAASRG